MNMMQFIELVVPFNHLEAQFQIVESNSSTGSAGGSPLDRHFLSRQAGVGLSGDLSTQAAPPTRRSRRCD